MNVSHEKWKSKKRHKKSYSSQNERQQLPPSDLEIQLLAQRQRHQIKEPEAICNLSNPEVGRIVSIPGLEYDASSDRYFRKSQTPQQKAARCLMDSSMPICDKGSKSHSIMQLLSSRNVVSYDNFHSSRNLAHSKYTAASFLFKPLYGVIEADQFPDSDANFHHVHGLARTSSRAIAIYHHGNQRNTSINLSSFTRLRGSSNPHWRPSNIGYLDEKPAFAVLVHSETFVQTVLLQKQYDEQSVHSSGFYRSFWKSSKIGGLSCRDQGSVKNIRWSDCGHQLLMLCDSGIWMTNIERSLMNVSTNSNSNANEVPFNRGSIILSNGNISGKATSSYAVAVCNSKCNEHVKFVGFRNGGLVSLDTRSKSVTVDIGKLPYCIDHIESLHDDITLVAQDITGKISLYDCRMPSRLKNEEYMCVTNGFSKDVRKNRRFWLSPDERIVIAPSHKRFETAAGPCQKDSSCLTAYSLNLNGRVSDAVKYYGGGKENNNNHNNDYTLSKYELEIPVNHHQPNRRCGAAVATLDYVPSSVKLCTQSGGHHESGDVDDLCSGLYGVANVTCRDPHRNDSDGKAEVVGSALFKASCARTCL